MRFISPSFNNQGWTASFDLNSVAFETSPAYSLGAEHPTGAEYAKYLDGLATQGELNIQYSTQVTAVRPDRTAPRTGPWTRPRRPRCGAATSSGPRASSST